MAQTNIKFVLEYQQQKEKKRNLKEYLFGTDTKCVIMVKWHLDKKVEDGEEFPIRKKTQFHVFVSIVWMFFWLIHHFYFILLKTKKVKQTK